MTFPSIIRCYVHTKGRVDYETFWEGETDECSIMQLHIVTFNVELMEVGEIADREDLLRMQWWTYVAVIVFTYTQRMTIKIQHLIMTFFGST